ncbi:MAG: hypothetical protein ABL962_21860, partial [Fimbriimonadaceae bacterium]
LRRAAHDLHFTDRTDEAIIEAARESSRCLALYRRYHVSLKRSDAELLVKALVAFQPGVHNTPPFALSESPYWREAFAGPA